MAKRRIHLVANAHIDPVWLWEWPEGAGEALSTFRQAAEFCEKRGDFVFCHNEAVLYRWVEEHEPALFRRIKALVRRKKWHVMGGWHVQPDCNMPSGESFVRQILLGRRYFKDKFGVEPRTAVNLDPFGHTRGLVQILAKSGYTAYLCCRPGDSQCPLPRDEFVWVGYDGSEVLANRASAHYCSPGGKERARLEAWLAENPDGGLAIHLWGVGDHGGGPSRRDLAGLEALRRERRGLELVHSTPDDYFRELEAERPSLPRREKDLNPWAVGCYTSMARVKQGHRRLENELYSAEKMAAAAWVQGLMAYPREEFEEAMRDLAFVEFHDILPGSAIPSGEDGALRTIGHGLEILSRVKARAFFALAAGEPRAAAGEVPLFVFNPHGQALRTLVECEFEPWEPNTEGGFWVPRLFGPGGRELPVQLEKEESNLSVEWRKRVVFEAELPANRLTRFSCRLERAAERPKPAAAEESGAITVATADLVASVGVRTGLLDAYRAGGADLLAPGAFIPLVIRDNADPWGMKVRAFRALEGTFKPATPEETARFCGLRDGVLAPVRVVEDGPVRTVVEAVFAYGASRLLFHYKVPKRGTEIEVGVRVFWAERDAMLKLGLAPKLRAPRFLGQVAYGADELPSNGDEAVAQKWLALASAEDGLALTVANDGTYGSDWNGAELRLTLLRSPAYAADTWEDRLAVAGDRFVARQDVGERTFRFWLDGGPSAERLERIGREALARNEAPYALAYFPPGGRGRKRSLPGVVVEGEAVELAAFKRSEDGRDAVVRLFEPTGAPRRVTVKVPALGAKAAVRLGGFEIKTLRVDRRTKSFRETDLLERRAGKG
ncbi:MAG TPA: glycoside hydrolase family 38 C-terminal domain-containing protein [Candidatus Aminicenantes bacterium]|nr:glycoside hydrolase family 38 C-terminal domain-containing protein [Candidatus Aminicenantes bacterium]